MNFNNPILFRISIINDFRNTFACIDYKKFGEVMILGAWLVSPPHRGYNLKDDDIGVFVNFKQIARVKSKDEAIKLIERLIESAPPEAQRELREHQDYLLRSL